MFWSRVFVVRTTSRLMLSIVFKGVIPEDIKDNTDSAFPVALQICTNGDRRQTIKWMSPS